MRHLPLEPYYYVVRKSKLTHAETELIDKSYYPQGQPASTATLE
jgi:hypothetical protein